MDEAWNQALVEDAAAIGVAVTAEAAAAMAKHVDLLLTWNAKINLTRIVAVDEIRAKHCIDSLGALALVPTAVTSVLDMGAGAGFPGIPWLCVRPGLRLTMVDAVAKKVGFLKTALATLRLSGGKALHARLDGQLDREHLEAVDMVVSRAFMDLARVLQLARPYLAPTGSLLAMLGPRETPDDAHRIATAMSFDVAAERGFVLPGGMGERRVMRLVPRGTT